jgi:hypothetical protein
MAHQCADLQIAILLENFVNKSDHVCPIELAIGGNESLAQRFLADLEEFIGPDRLFTYNSHLARFTLHNATLPSTASANVDSAERVPSNLFLISSPEDIDGILMSQDSTTPSYGLPPIFVQVNFNSNEDAGFHKACRSLAVDFRGTLMVLRNDTRRRHSNEEEEGAGGGQQYEDAVSMDDSLFSQEQLFRALCEVCAIQLESGYADLCLRISVMCGDPFTLDYITPLLEKAVRIDTSGL